LAGRTQRSSSENSKQKPRKDPKPKIAERLTKVASKKRGAPDIPQEAPIPHLEKLEQKIGYVFSDSRIFLQALTHRSYSQEVIPPEEDNERLEFLGDAVLQLIVTKRLWTELLEEDEGVLTRRRSEKVSGRALAKVARAMGIAAFLRLGKGELKTGGRQKSSILADTFEAVVGAIYLDAGYERCADVLELWLWRMPEDSEDDILANDYKSHLQQELQQTSKLLPVYHVLSETGPEHNKIFRVEVRHGGRVLGTGQGRNKKEAEQAAAQQSILANGETRGHQK
jgi:ribonuclease-3